MPQGARGEAILTVDGQRYEVLFTNRALAEAESITGKTVTQLLDRAAIGMTDLAGLLLVGMEAARRDTDPKRARYVIADAWDLIDRAGFLPVLQAVTNSLVAVLLFSGEDEEEAADPPA